MLVKFSVILKCALRIFQVVLLVTEKAMAPHSSTLAWKIPWTKEPGRLQSMGSQRDMTEQLHFHFSLSCIGEGNGKIPGTGEPGGLPSMGSHRVGHDWSDLAAAAAIKHWALFSTFLIITLRAKSCLTLCDPMDCSPPGPSVHGISQARILEWIAIFFST